MKISDHITYAEAIHSQTAKRKGIDNTPNPNQIEANKFDDWDKLENVVYYRADIAACPAAKKKYKVRMAPTLIIFKDGIKEVVFKAGLDLMLPAELNEIQEAVNEVSTASQF